MRIATRAAVHSSGMGGINRFGGVAMPMASCLPFVRRLRGHIGGTARLCIERLQGQDRNQNNEQESQPRMHIDRWNRNYSALAGHRSTALLINHECFLTNHSASGGRTAGTPIPMNHLICCTRWTAAHVDRRLARSNRQASVISRSSSCHPPACRPSHRPPAPSRRCSPAS